MAIKKKGREVVSSDPSKTGVVSGIGQLFSFVGKGGGDISELDDDTIMSMAKIIGISTSDLDNDELRKELASLAQSGGGLSFGKDNNFSDFWDEGGFIDSTTDGSSDSKRRIRYTDYDFMLANSSEVAMAHRAYLDESIGLLREDDKFFKIKVMDSTGNVLEEDTRLLTQAMENGGVFSDLRSLFSNLITYGDHFFRVEDVKMEGEDRVPVLNGYHVDKPIKVQRINLPHKDVPYKFRQRRTTRGNPKDVAPWDMIHFRLDSSRHDIAPYGEPLIEPVRSIYKRLLIVEALLALTRSSRTERLVIKVPTNAENPETALTKLVRYKSLVKNLMMGSGTSMSSENKHVAFTDVLFIPKGKTAEQSFEIERLQASVDLSSIEDVEYFQDKLYSGLSLPRGYFKSDDAYMGFRKLALQDLKFSRAVNSIVRPVAEGLATLGKIILFRSGRWSEDRTVEVSYLQPSPLASEQLGSLRDALDIITQIIETISSPDPDTGEFKKDRNMIRTLLMKFANFSQAMVDSILPLGSSTKEEVVTTEEIKRRAVIAFCSSQETVVSSKYIDVVNFTKSKGKKDSVITEEFMI